MKYYVIIGIVIIVLIQSYIVYHPGVRYITAAQYNDLLSMAKNDIVGSFDTRPKIIKDDPDEVVIMRIYPGIFGNKREFYIFIRK